MNKVKTGLREKNTAEKLKMAKKIANNLPACTQLGVNPDLIVELNRALLALEKGMDIASFGDRRAIGAKNLCEQELENVIRKVALVVDHKSQGNSELIKQVGFETRKRNNQPAELEKPENILAKRTGTPKELLIKWSPVKNSRSYLVEMSTSEPTNRTKWNSSGFTTRSRHVFTKLKAGQYYWIRVKAIGAIGLSEPSNVIKIMAA